MSKELTIKEMLNQIIERLDSLEKSVEAIENSLNLNKDKERVSINNKNLIDSMGIKIIDNRIDKNNKIFYETFKEIFKPVVKSFFSTENQSSYEVSIGPILRNVFNKYTQEIGLLESSFILKNDRVFEKRFKEKMNKFNKLKDAYTASKIKKTDFEDELDKFNIEAFYNELEVAVIEETVKAYKRICGDKNETRGYFIFRGGRT